MLADELITYVESPDRLENQSLGKLDQIISRYPYFQTARILYIKNLQNIYGKVDKNDLNLTAAFVSDRKVLYYLLHTWQEVNRKSEEKVSDENVSEEVIQKKPERLVKDTLHENISDTLGKQQSYLYYEPGPEIELIPGMAIDIRKEYGDGIDLDDTSFSFGNFRITGGKADGILEIEEEKKESDIIDDQTQDKNTEISVSETKPVETQISDQAESKVMDSDEEKEVQDAKSFNDWLNVVNDKSSKVSVSEQAEPVQQQPEEETDLSHVAQIEPETKKEKEVTIGNKEGDTTEEKTEEQTPDSLVDRFIKENPRIIPKKEPTPLYDISTDSVKEHESLFTDTLAHIYIKQGNYTKAILVYEKLSLKFPEKSAYFAGQISEIKKLINK